MSTVNKAKVYAKLKVHKALIIQSVLDRKRLRPFYEYEGIPGGYRHVGFAVPLDMTVAEAILLLSRLVPEGTEIHAS